MAAYKDVTVAMDTSSKYPFLSGDIGGLKPSQALFSGFALVRTN